MPENPAGIGETVRIFPRGGIEQNPNGFLRLRAENNGAGKQLLRLVCVSIDIENTVRAIMRGVYEDFVDHGVRNERAVS